MDLGEIIRARKENVEIHEWKDGKVPRAKFPLSKARSGLQMGSEWRWRLVTFTALGHDFRLLLRLNRNKEYFAAVLGLEVDGDTAVICHHELHTSHKGWHCHYVKGDVRATLPGVLRDRDRMRSWPTFAVDDPGEPFVVTEATALSVAAARFRFRAQGDLI